MKKIYVLTYTNHEREDFGPVSEIVAVADTATKLLSIITSNFHEEAGVWHDNQYRLSAFENYEISSHFIL
jgi:hypothetical protein